MKSFAKTSAAILLGAALLAGCSSTGGGPSAGGGTSTLVTPASIKGSVKIAEQTETQKAIGKCIASVGFGAVLGGIIGEATGAGAGSGMVVGAALGAGACAVFMQVAAEEDQRRMRAYEKEAVLSSLSVTKPVTAKKKFTTKTGKEATVTTTVVQTPVPSRIAALPAPSLVSASPSAGSTPAKPFNQCRSATQTVEVQGQQAQAGKQLWCRNEATEWLPVQ